MNLPYAHVARRVWVRRLPPLVRIGWFVATAGRTRPVSQTAVGVGMMAAGIVARRSKKSRNRPIYVYTSNPGETTRIRVYRGNAAPSEVTVRT